jgi:hypothetical protein
VKSSLQKNYEMTNLEHLHYFLGLQVLQTQEGISPSQPKYAYDLLHCFHMNDCKPVPSPFQSGVKLSISGTSPKVDATLYGQLVSNLSYFTHIHLSISFVVGLIARYMKEPHKSHWKATKMILWCIRGTIQFGIQCSSRESPMLVGFTDSDKVGDLNDRKSTAGYVFNLGSNHVTWACKNVIPDI